MFLVHTTFDGKELLNSNLDSSVSFIPFFVFRFWFLVTFADEVTKILCNLCLHFARQDGQDGKNQKENHATKVTKIPKTIRRKYGMNETIYYITSSTFLSFQKWQIYCPSQYLLKAHCLDLDLNGLLTRRNF